MYRFLLLILLAACNPPAATDFDTEITDLELTDDTGSRSSTTTTDDRPTEPYFWPEAGADNAGDAVIYYPCGNQYNTTGCDSMHATELEPFDLWICGPDRWVSDGMINDNYEADFIADSEHWECRYVISFPVDWWCAELGANDLDACDDLPGEGVVDVQILAEWGTVAPGEFTVTWAHYPAVP